MKRIILFLLFLLSICYATAVPINQSFNVDYQLNIMQGANGTGTIQIIIDNQTHNFPVFNFNYSGTQAIIRPIETSILNVTNNSLNLSCPTPVFNTSYLNLTYQPLNMSNISLSCPTPTINYTAPQTCPVCTCNPAPCVNECPKANEIADAMTGKINTTCPTMECNNEGLLVAINEIKNKQVVCNSTTTNTETTDDFPFWIIPVIIGGIAIIVLIVWLIKSGKLKMPKAKPKQPKQQPQQQYEESPKYKDPKDFKVRFS